MSEYEEVSATHQNQPYEEKSLLLGPGLSQFPELPRFESLDELSAAKIAKLAWEMFERDEFVDPADFVPNYSQDFVPKTSKKKLSL